MADNLQIILDILAKDKASKEINVIKSSLDGLNSSFKIVGAAAASFGAIFGASFALNKTIEAASRQEDAINRLGVALRVTGGYSQDALKDFEDFAAGIEATTRFGDEAVLEQLRLAKSMGATNEQAKDIVKAATDLSVALGIDLNSATRNISKTLGGLSGELGETIPQLKTLGREALMSGEGIKLIGDKFKGFAEQDVSTFSGAMAQAGNMFGSLMEALGSFIISSPQIQGAIIGVSQEVLRLIQYIGSANNEGFGNFIVSATNAAAAVLKSFDWVLSGLRNLVPNILYTIQSFIYKFADNIIGAAQTVSNAFGIKTFDNAKEGLKGLSKQLSDLGSQIRKDYSEGSVLTKIADAIGRIGEKASEFSAKNKLKLNVDANLTSLTKESTTVFTKDLAEGINKALQLAGQGISQGGIEGARTIATGVASMFGPWGMVIGQFINIFGREQEEFKKNISSLIDGFADLPILIEDNIPNFMNILTEKAPMVMEKIASNAPLVITKVVQQFPLMVAKLVVEIVKNLPNMAKAFVESLVREAPKFVQALIEEIANGGQMGQAVGIDTGGFFEGVGDFFGGMGDLFGFASGGKVHKVMSPIQGKDIVPAKLMAGELVVDRDTTSKLDNFLNNAGSFQSMPASYTIQINQREFGRILVDGNRNNTRGFNGNLKKFMVV